MHDTATIQFMQPEKLAEHVRKYVDIPQLYQILSDD